MAQSPRNGTPTAFQAKQALSRAQQAERRYQDDQKIGQQIDDPELKAQVLLDSETTRSRELEKSNTVLEQTNNYVPVVPSASTETLNAQLGPTTELPAVTSDTILNEQLNQALPAPDTLIPVNTDQIINESISQTLGPPPELPAVTREQLASPKPASGTTPGGSASPSPSNTNATASATTSTNPVSSTNADGATANTTSIPKQLGDVKFNFQDNEFNQYDRVAYHFRLVLVNDLDANDPDVGRKIINNQVRKFIICESGVTLGFNLTDVTITDIVSPNFRSRSNMTTEIRLKMIEPYGMTLPDRLYNASKQLGIPQWRLAPLFLELEFRYIKSDGTIYNPQGEQKLIKVYSLNIIEFDSQLTESGTVYDLQCVAKDNMGFRDFYQIMTKTHSVETKGMTINPNGNSVGGFFESLGKVITDRYAKERKDNITSQVVPPVMEYMFVVDKDLAKQEINYDDTVSARRRSFKGTSNGEITIARGISVTALVDDVLASIKEVKFFIADQYAGLIKIPRLECITENIGWDGLRKDYIRRFTFVIGLKTSPRPIPYRQLAEELQSDAQRQQSRLKILAENMKKAYEYWYTGKNTEILSLDVKFNQLHVVVEPALQTTLPPELTDSKKVDTRDAVLKQKANLEQERKLWTNPQADAVNPDTQLKETLRLNEEIQRTEERLMEINTDSIYLFDANSQLRPMLGLGTTPSQKEQQAITQLQNLRSNLNKASQVKQFVEDVSRQIMDNNRLQLSWSTDPRDMQNTQTRAFAGTTNSNDPTSSTRAIVSSILTQIYDRSGTQMLEIDMEIRGDPYWLGLTDVERTVELREIVNKLNNNQSVPNNLGNPTNTNNNSQFVNVYDTDATILLKFRSGGQPSSETGFQNLEQESDFFYGIYIVLEVNHEFKDGKFTQRLKAMRDTLIDLTAIRAAEKQGMSTNQPNTLPGVTPTNSPLQPNNGVNTTQLINNGESSGKMIARASNNPNTNQIALTPQQSTSSAMATNNSDYISGNSPEAVAARNAQLGPIRQQSQNTEFAGYKGTQAANLGPSLNLMGVDGLGQGDNSRSVYLPQSTTYQRAGILEPGQSSMGYTIDPNTEYVDEKGLIQLKK